VSDWVAELSSDDTFTAEDYDNRDKCPNCIQKEREASMAWDRIQELDRALRLACEELGKEPSSPFAHANCPYWNFQECVIPFENRPKVVCKDIRSNCWRDYYLSKAKANPDV
jgi:hypothetical protein